MNIISGLCTGDQETEGCRLRECFSSVHQRVFWDALPHVDFQHIFKKVVLIPVIPALQSLRQEGHEFMAI
jgi:hypothetical protein